MEDCRSPEGPKPLEDYVARWPTHREAIAAAYAEVMEGGAAAGATPSGNEPAERVGPYELVRRIGQGGQGLVYLARDTRLDRTVALKMLTGLARASFVAMERFRREAMIASRLEHPGICRVYEAGQGDGEPYIVMQFIEGEPLSKMRDTLSLEQGVVVVREVASAVHEAHRLGLIHRDIKPQNILVGKPEDGPHKPYVVDFGLAREVSDRGQTSTGAGVGTPAYMPPDQARGDIRAGDRHPVVAV